MRLSPNARPRARISSARSGAISLRMRANPQPRAVCPDGYDGSFSRKARCFRHGEGFAILLERPRALVVVLRGVGREADIAERAAQQVVQIRGVLLGDLRVERAGKDLHEVRHVQLEVGGRQREARGVAQRERVLGDLHIEREGGRAGGGRRGNQGEAVRQRLGVQVALQRAQIRVQDGTREQCRACSGPGRWQRSGSSSRGTG